MGAVRGVGGVDLVEGLERCGRGWAPLRLAGNGDQRSGAVGARGRRLPRVYGLADSVRGLACGRGAAQIDVGRTESQAA